MRTVRVSETARIGLQRLLDQGVPKFGETVVEEKALLVNSAMHGALRRDPRTGFFDDRQKFYAYPVSNTPFTIVDRFDDAELQILFIVHKSADRTRLNPGKVKW
jgi:hypothetical protein